LGLGVGLGLGLGLASGFGVGFGVGLAHRAAEGFASPPSPPQRRGNAP